VRQVLYPCESFEALSKLLDASCDEQEISLSGVPSARDGEWVLATFNIGEDSIAVAGQTVEHADGLSLAFLDRDWEVLTDFAHSAPLPSSPVPCSEQPQIAMTAPADCKALVVDDDPDVRTVVSAVLGRSGFVVSLAASAEEAFDELRQSKVDLLVLDWNLPGMSGIELCQRLRRDARNEHLAILFLTAHSSSQDLVNAFAAGADDFVSKPFRAPELAARVLGLVRRAHLSPPVSRRSIAAR
jgi:two-component system, OmpR family, phosphate regulon response regulator PhoB